MKPIILDDDQFYKLIQKFSQFGIESQVINKALSLTTELPLLEIEGEITYFKQAYASWQNSDPCSEEEKVALRKCIEFVNEAHEIDGWSSTEENLLSLFGMAQQSDDEDNQMLIIRKMAEEIILKVK